MSRPDSYRTLALLVLTACAGRAFAQAVPPTTAAPPGRVGATTAATPPPRLGVWLGHADSDNLARSAPATEGSYDSLGLLLGLAKNSQRLTAHINSDLEYRSYSLNTLDNETIGTLDAAAEVGIVPDRFMWTFRGNEGQGVRDPAAAFGPLNRQSISTIGSGPKLSLPLGGRMSFSLDGEYSKRRYDQSVYPDSDSVLYDVGLFRRTSQTGRIGIQASTDTIDFSGISAPSYKIDSVSVRYEKTLATGRVIAAVGNNRADTGVATSSNPLVNFEWTRAVASRSTLSVNADRAFTDAGNELSVAPIVTTTNGAAAVALVASPIERQNVSVVYRLNGVRTSADVSVGRFEDAYLTSSAFDNKGTALRVAVNHTISMKLAFNVAWDRTERNMNNAPGSPTYEEATLSASVNRTLGRRFNVAGVIARYERRGVAPVPDEHRYEIRFGYSPTQNAGAPLGLMGR